MKMMLLAAAAALTLGSATAFASDGGDWYPPNTAATQYQAPVNHDARQQAPRQSLGSTYMYFGAASDQGQQFNPNFGGGGNG